ncbi:MAG: HDOD domain-containing protein, partial [Proteobacteria bacterium]|nr:HDOD domain-containing protein [Pseudomonadota bacterium]
QIQTTGEEFCKAEERFFPFTHPEVGQLIGERWRFTEELLEVLRWHHDPFPTTLPARITLPQLVKCADHIAHVHGFGHPRGFAKFQHRCEDSLPGILEFLRIDPSEGRPLLQDLKKTVELELDLYAGKKL